MSLNHNYFYLLSSVFLHVPHKSNLATQFYQQKVLHFVHAFTLLKAVMEYSNLFYRHSSEGMNLVFRNERMNIHVIKLNILLRPIKEEHFWFTKIIFYKWITHSRGIKSCVCYSLLLTSVKFPDFIVILPSTCRILDTSITEHLI
jgi:hypothetical protein